MISSKYVVNYGTPQGSCLGPLLFLLFCNDLNLHLTFLSCIQFADDATLYLSSRDLNYVKNCCNLDMIMLQDWFHANKLTLNIGKSVCMLFKLKGKIGELELTVATKKIKAVKSSKFLGIFLDDELNWKEHIKALLTKLKSKIGMLYKAKNMLSEHSKRIIYFAQIQSHLTYGMAVWGSMLSGQQLKELQTFQNKCVKQIDLRMSLQDVYKNYNILKVKSLINLENVKLWHKLHLDKLPPPVKKEYAT